MGHSKEKAKEYLAEKYGWKDYGGIHLENKMTAFHHNYYVFQKFGYDGRENALAASVREGTITRHKAIEELSKPPEIEKSLVKHFKSELKIGDYMFYLIMRDSKKTYMDYENYKKIFERLKPMFYVLAKCNLIPMSFYLKYCKNGGPKHG